MFNIARGETSSSVEVDTDELSETGRVVVSDGLGVSESLEHRVGLDDLVLQGDLLGSIIELDSLGLRLLGSDSGEVGNNLFGVLGLSGSRFSSNQHGLIFVIVNHVSIGLVGYSEQMGWHFVTSLAQVHLN